MTHETTPLLNTVPIEKIVTNNSAIHCAATGNLSSLKAILNCNASLIDARDHSNSTLIVPAVVGDHDNVLSFLRELNGMPDLDHGLMNMAKQCLI
jgi:hypothetical protein